MVEPTTELWKSVGSPLSAVGGFGGDQRSVPQDVFPLISTFLIDFFELGKKIEQNFDFIEIENQILACTHGKRWN